MFDSLWHDVRFSAATLRRSPAFVSLAVSVLALGMGFCVAVFSIVNAVFFRPVPVAEPDRLVYEYQILPRNHQTFITDFPTLEFLRKSDAIFESLTAHWAVTDLLRAGDKSLTATGELVTANYFDVLGVRVALGRAFVPAEDQLGTTERAMIISDRLWTRFFKRAPDIVGTRVRLGAHTFTIVGVAPPEFRGLSNPWSPTQWWVTAPQFFGAEYARYGTGVIGRIKRGITLEQARAAIAIQNKELWRERRTKWATAETNRPPNPAVLLPLASVRAPFWPDDEVIPVRLSAAVGVVVAMVLLVATANIAGILRARSLTRTFEIAIRRALGAGPVRLARQLTLESLLLSLASGVLGLVLARSIVAVYRRVTPDRYVVDVPFDWRVMAFTFGTCVGIGALIALAPAFQALRVNVIEALGSGGVGATRPFRTRLRHAVVIPQVACSLLLLLVAGVHVRALARIELAPAGVDLASTAMFDIAWIEDGPRLLSRTPETEEQQAARSRKFLASVLDRLQAVREADSIALADGSPIDDRQEAPRTFVGESAYVAGDRAGVGAYGLAVSPGYFATLGVRFRAGRDFDGRDVRQAPLAAIVSESAAAMLWPGQTAIGKRLTRYDASVKAPRLEWLTVVGVVADVHPILRPSVASPMVYLALTQQWRPDVGRVFTRMATMPPGLLGAVTQAVRSADPHADVSRVRRLSQVAGEMLYPRRTAASILTASGLVGLLLAAIGLYAVVSQSIAQRTRELSIRVALGANRRAITALVLREGWLVMACGAAIGVPLAVVALRATATLVGPVSVRDPIAFVAGTVVVASATLLACYGPARRAASADPAAALRSL